jgi:hypothetical protein
MKGFGRLAVAVGVALALQACATVPAASSKSVQKLPDNYRQLMAQYVMATWVSRFPIRGGKISQPHARPAGLFSSSAVPAVCVIAFRDNPLGQVVGENYIMTIKDGRVSQLPTINAESCLGFSTFHELLRR